MSTLPTWYLFGPPPPSLWDPCPPCYILFDIFLELSSSSSLSPSLELDVYLEEELPPPPLLLLLFLYRLPHSPHSTFPTPYPPYYPRNYISAPRSAASSCILAPVKEEKLNEVNASIHTRRGELGGVVGGVPPPTLHTTPIR